PPGPGDLLILSVLADPIGRADPAKKDQPHAQQLPPAQVEAAAAGKWTGDRPGTDTAGRGIGRQQTGRSDGHQGQRSDQHAQRTLHYRIPGCETAMPLRAILRASVFGATSRATERSIRSRFTRSTRLIVKSCIPSRVDMRITSPSLSSFSSKSSLRTVALNVM